MVWNRNKEGYKIVIKECIFAIWRFYALFFKLIPLIEGFAVFLYELGWVRIKQFKKLFTEIFSIVKPGLKSCLGYITICTDHDPCGSTEADETDKGTYRLSGNRLYALV